MMCKHDFVRKEVINLRMKGGGEILRKKRGGGDFTEARGGKKWAWGQVTR